MTGGAQIRTPPPRPDERGAPEPAARRWWPVAVVLLVVFGLTGGAQTLANTLTGPQEALTGFPGVVSLAPRPGWELASYESTGSVDRLVLTKGTVRLMVTAMPGFQRSAYDLALAYTRQREASLLSFSQGVSPQQTVLRSGLPAIQFGYTGVTFDREPVAGVVTVAVGPGGNGVVFDASWPEQDLAVPAGDIAAMIDGAAIA